MFRMNKPKNPYRKRQRSPYQNGWNPNQMVRDIGSVTMGVVGVGAMTTLGMGALNAIKPK
jgi:hypothetical protein